MCIIVHKPKGRTVDKATLERCFKANPDGAGYMFIEDGRVWGNKGFMNIDELLESLEESGLMRGNGLVKDRAITLHFRRATHGGVNRGNCHPFPVTDKVSLLKTRYWEADIGIVHNGIISIECRKGMSDSQEFVANVLATPAVSENLDDGGVQMAIALATKGSRLFILRADGTYIRTGDWVEEKGILYSNLSYMPVERRAQAQTWALTGDKSRLFPEKDRVEPDPKSTRKPPYSWVPKR